LVSSAQLKIILENSWTLETLERQNAISRLRFRIQRLHVRSEVTGQLNVRDDLFA
jgi:hypothetical protein